MAFPSYKSTVRHDMDATGGVFTGGIFTGLLVWSVWPRIPDEQLTVFRVLTSITTSVSTFGIGVGSGLVPPMFPIGILFGVAVIGLSRLTNGNYQSNQDDHPQQDLLRDHNQQRHVREKDPTPASGSNNGQSIALDCGKITSHRSRLTWHPNRCTPSSDYRKRNSV